jgi:hypothetical protein
MSTSLVHILTVIGRASEEVEAACDELLARRVPMRPATLGTDDWSENDQKDIQKFCVTLIAHTRKLPVLYYSQYLDSWSVADCRFRLLKWPDGKWRQVCGAGFGLVFYPSKFALAFLEQIKETRRTRANRTQPEDRWFIDHVAEAIQSALWLEAPFLVVSLSEVLGASRTDEDIKAALEVPYARF